MSLAGSRGGAPLWGLGQRPNCSTGDQYAKRAQQRCRQRSVPASNFALPQKRPQAALLRKQGFRACGRDQRAFRSPFGNLRRRNFWGCLRLDFYRCRKNRACGRESCHHCLAMGQPPRADGCKNHPNCDQKMKNPRKMVIMLAREYVFVIQCRIGRCCIVLFVERETDGENPPDRPAPRRG